MIQKVSISLPPQTVYVSGTVNGVDKVFTRNGNLWETEANKSNNNTYHISVTAVDSLGKANTLSTIVYYGLNLITDRTSQDVTMGTAKGYYNYTDLNRVEAAVSAVGETLTDNGYPTTPKEQKTWALGDIPTYSEMAIYLKEVVALANQLALPLTLWEDFPDTINYLDYRGANSIEQLLEDIVIYLGLMEQQRVYSGTVYAGEVW